MAALEQRYALALDGLVEAGKVDADSIGRELAALAAMLESSPALGAVLASPALAWERKRDLLKALAARAGWSRLARNFLLVVVERGRAAWLPAMQKAFEALRLDKQGVVRADIASARELDAAERAALERELSARLGRKLLAHYSRDAALLGGFRARVGDEVFDGSLRGRLSRLRQTLLSTERI